MTNKYILFMCSVGTTWWPTLIYCSCQNWAFCLFLVLLNINWEFYETWLTEVGGISSAELTSTPTISVLKARLYCRADFNTNTIKISVVYVQSDTETKQLWSPFFMIKAIRWLLLVCTCFVYVLSRGYRICIKRPIHCQLNWASLLRDVIPDGEKVE